VFQLAANHLPDQRLECGKIGARVERRLDVHTLIYKQARPQPAIGREAQPVT
jgi:hypothetical protein